MSARTPFAGSTDENNNQRPVNSSYVCIDKGRFVFVAAKIEKTRQLSSRLESECFSRLRAIRAMTSRAVAFRSDERLRSRPLRPTAVRNFVLD